MIFYYCVFVKHENFKNDTNKKYHGVKLNNLFCNDFDILPNLGRKLITFNIL